MESVKKTYKLPYPSSEYDPLLAMANNSNAQAKSAEYYAGLSMIISDNTYEEILAKLDSNDKDVFVKPVNLASDSMVMAIDSAISARQAELEALRCINEIIIDIYSRQQDKANAVNRKMQTMYKEAKLLSKRYTNELGQVDYASMPQEAANKLAGVLEKVHKVNKSHGFHIDLQMYCLFVVKSKLLLVTK